MAQKKWSEFAAGSALTGTEIIPGIASGVNRRWTAAQIATYITALITDSAPATLDTLNELAAALGDDPNFAATMATALAGKQPLDIDLTAIAALSTTSWGRALLTMADAPALRSAIASSYIAHQSAVAAAVTGTATETTLATFTIPANSLGPNGSVDILFLAGWTNSANTKTLRLRVNSTQVLALTATATASGQFLFSLANRGATNSQVANASNFTGLGSTGAAEQTFSFDTTADLTVTITGQLATAGEDIHLARRRCVLYPGV